MKWKLWKGIWDKWLEGEDVQLRQWFRELDTFLSRAFQNRISLRDNVFCSFVEQKNVLVNQDILRADVLTSPAVEGVVLLESSEPGMLTWSVNGFDLTYKITTSATGPITFVKLAIFYRGG